MHMKIHPMECMYVKTSAEVTPAITYRLEDTQCQFAATQEYRRRVCMYAYSLSVFKVNRFYYMNMYAYQTMDYYLKTLDLKNQGQRYYLKITNQPSISQKQHKSQEIQDTSILNSTMFVTCAIK